MTVPYDLINAYFTQSITADEFRELSTWLEAKSEHLDILMKESKLHTSMYHVLKGEKLCCEENSTLVNAGSMLGSDFSVKTVEQISWVDKNKVRQIEQYAQQQLDKFLKQQQQETSRPEAPRPIWNLNDLVQSFAQTIRIVCRKTVTIAKLASIGFGVAVICLFLGLYINEHRSVAIIAESADAQWLMPMDDEAVLYRGEYHLEEGYTRLLMRQGAEVLLQAPCSFQLQSSNRLFLESGSLCAIVPKRAQGFTVETIDSRIVDYGTEFGTKVGSDDVEVHVFKGNVGVGTRSLSNNADLQDVITGQAAVLKPGSEIKLLPLDVRTRLFTRSLPKERGLGVPGKRIDLADLVGNGNGFGTGQLGLGLDFKTGQIVPVQSVDNSAVRSGYISLSGMSFIDGIFIPDSEQGLDIVVASTGLTFRGCPDTSGGSRGYLVNGATFQNHESKHFGRLQGRAFGTKAFPSIGMHANAGVTFDLEALRISIPNRHITSFKSLCGVSETVALFCKEGYYGNPQYRVTVDFWVLVDGKVHFHDTLNAVPSEPVSIDVALPHTARFLTLMTTESQGGRSFCWGMFAKPVLELELINK
ncbi:NPCBM/NEW2 domain-containing protein [Planctomycetota bacterium]